MKLIIALLTFTSVAAFLPPHAGRKSVAVSHHGHDEEHDITFKVSPHSTSSPHGSGAGRATLVDRGRVLSG